MKEPEVTLELARDHGLSDDEFRRIQEILGRRPNFTELGIYSVMWSEHCSYKNSIAELKKLPRSGPRLLVSAGEENAGLVDIGDGLAIAFKIESHNHPSAVEPYQGAATGVGGILRDIFTMGARPIAALNSLRFGNIEHPRTKFLLRGVVRGIADYGNSFGVPTVAGEIYFDDCYNENPLVNAMAIGVVDHNRIVKAIARGSGNGVFIVGSATGRDGIHGATFASEEISEKSESKRPSVQVGDPFTEKLLLEATLEAIRLDLIVGIQDMGAAGITCSTSEMSAKGNAGMQIDLERVPMREKGMIPYEIMLSESQERMLVIVKPEHEKNIKEVFAKWDLHCDKIGTVHDKPTISISMNGRAVAEVPPESLVLGGGAPVYLRQAKVPEYMAHLHQFDPLQIPEPTDYSKVLIDLLRSPNICSRKPVTVQYDSMVQTSTVIGQYADAAVIRLKESSKAIAAKTDCNSRYVYLNPYRGAQIAVAECARNLVCVGAKPLAITNCLNFGNPYKPEIFWQFKEAVRGIGDACIALGTPVTGGNVSFYNEGPSGAIFPTPVIGMIGEIASLEKTMTADFKESGDVIVLLGRIRTAIGGSEYLKYSMDIVAGDAPDFDLKEELTLQTLLFELIENDLVRSAHDVSEGGLAVAIAESLIYASRSGKNLGADIAFSTELRMDLAIFSEFQSAVIISCKPTDLHFIQHHCLNHGVDFQQLGHVTEGEFTINDRVRIKPAVLAKSFESGLLLS